MMGRREGRGSRRRRVEEGEGVYFYLIISKEGGRREGRGDT